MLESRLAKYQDLVPQCERLAGLGIGLGELIAFYIAIEEKAANFHLPLGTAAYSVIEDIEDYQKLGGLKKQLSNMSMQLCMMNQFLSGQRGAIMALVKLQCYGIKESQIIDLCRTIEMNYHNMNSPRSMNSAERNSDPR